MRAGLLAAGAILIAAGAALGNDQRIADAERCAAISDSLARLTCFDRVFPEGEQESEPRPTSSVSSPWSIDRSTSPLDDSPSIIAALSPTDTTSASYMGGGMLGLRCIEDTTSVIITTDMYISGNSGRVTYRIGSEPATTTNWNVSETGRAVGLWTGAQAIPFIMSLSDNDRLAVRIEGTRRMDATFDLGDVSNVVEEIAEACNWPR